MPRNKWIYYGVLLVAASALIYIGGRLISLIEWILPWTAGVGVTMILIGLLTEMQKNNKPASASSKTAAQEQQSSQQ